MNFSFLSLPERFFSQSRSAWRFFSLPNHQHNQTARNSFTDYCKPRESSLCLWYNDSIENKCRPCKGCAVEGDGKHTQSFINLLSHTASLKGCPAECLAGNHNNNRWENGSQYYINHSVWCSFFNCWGSAQIRNKDRATHSVHTGEACPAKAP